MIYFVGPEPLIKSELYQLASLQDVITYCEGRKLLGFDTETTGLCPHSNVVTMIQIGDEENQFVIDVRTIDITPLFPILTTQSLIGTNIKFDYKMMKGTFGIELSDSVLDVQLIEKVLQTGKDDLEFRLINLVQKYCPDYPIEKDTTLSFTTMDPGAPFNEDQIVYGARDVQYPMMIYKLQLPQIEDWQLQNVVWLECLVSLAFGDIEFNGLNLDVPKWLELAKEAQSNADKLSVPMDAFILNDPKMSKFVKKEIQMDMFTPFEDLRKVESKWSSPTQVLEIFKVYIPELQSVNAKTDLSIHTNHPIIGSLIKDYIKYKEELKKATSYGTAFLKYINPVTKRIHTRFNQILNTGRVASLDPNMQQIPADNRYRNCFIAHKPGWVFVSSDFMSQELCVIAYGSQDPVWKKCLATGEDLHSVCADLLFKERWSSAAQKDCDYVKSKQKCNCKEHKKLRQSVKALNFGLAYGMSAHKLADTLQIPLSEAEELINSYFKAFPAIKVFLDSLGSYATTYGHIRTFRPFRRVRHFSKWSKDMDFKTRGEIERAGKNTPIQGSSGDMVKLALIKIRETIRKERLPVRLVMTVHDQIDTECEESYAKEWAIRLTSLMEQAADIILLDRSLKSETTITTVWSK